MHIKKYLIAAAALGMMVAPAAALSLTEAMDEVAGMYCEGSTCTATTEGTRVETITSSHRVSDGLSGEHKGFAFDHGKSKVCKFGNGTPMLNVNPVTCVANSIGPFGGQELFHNVSTSRDVEIPTVTVTTKELGFDPEAEPGNEWSVTTTTETHDAD